MNYMLVQFLLTSAQMSILVANTLKRNSNAKMKRSIRCVETGVIYASCSDASDILSFTGILIDPRNIFLVCSGKQKTAGGFHWEYFDNEV